MGIRSRYSFNTPAKVLGCLSAAFGGLLVVFGIIARIQVHHWTSIMLIGIWCGVLIMGAGAVGVVGAYRRMDMKRKRCFIITFVFMSLIALCLALIVVVCYGLAVQEFFYGKQLGDFSWYKWDDQPEFKQQHQDRARGITAVMLGLGIAELIVAFLSLIHGLMCCCCRKWHQLKHEELKDRHRNSVHSDRS